MNIQEWKDEEVVVGELVKPQGPMGPPDPCPSERGCVALAG